MTPPIPVLFDPELLQRYAIVRSTPFWKDVKESMMRLQPLLQPEANPYDQMDLDRDNVLRFAANLQNSADSIGYAICLAAHLARFSKTQKPEQRLTDGFLALSTGLDLASLPETETRSELERCTRAAFPDLELIFPPLSAQASVSGSAPVPAAAIEHAPEPAVAVADSGEQSPSANASTTPMAASQPATDPWRSALEAALSKISVTDPPPMDDVTRRAEDSWQARLLAFISGPSAQPEIPPDIDYLRCRAANHPLGVVLRGRLKNVSLREWNEAYVSGISLKGVPTPVPGVPLWFALAALGALGFDVPRETNSGKAAASESNAAANFVLKIPTTSPPKGLLILRLTAESQTAEWKLSPSMPALILTPEEWLREGKIDLQSYLQARLHGVLIEMARDEAPAAAQTRANINAIRERLPGVRVGFLMIGQNSAATNMANGVVAVKPANALEAHSQAFASGQVS